MVSFQHQTDICSAKIRLLFSTTKVGQKMGKYGNKSHVCTSCCMITSKAKIKILKKPNDFSPSFTYFPLLTHYDYQTSSKHHSGFM